MQSCKNHRQLQLTSEVVLLQVTAATEAEARQELQGTALPKLGAPTQQLRFTGSYGDTAYVVKAPQGDPATVYAHNSIWPSKVDPKMPYVSSPPQGSGFGVQLLHCSTGGLGCRC